MSTVGVRLWALLGFVVVVAAVAAYFFASVLNQARIGSERYQEIVAIHDLAADVRLPALNLVEPQLTLQGMALAEETTPVVELPGFAEFEVAYGSTYATLLDETTDPEVRAGLVAANQAAQDYFTEVEGDFTEAAAAGDRKAMRLLLDGPIDEKYLAHEEIITDVARLADLQALAAERQARQALRADKNQLLMIGLGLGLIGIALTAWTLRSLSTRLRGMREVASKEYPKLVAEAEVAAESGGERASYAVPPIRGKDELARTERALHRVVGNAVQLAGDQAGLRHATAEMFAYHGRRNHLLLTQGLAAIDALERNDDGARSGELAQLRSSLTRMRLQADGMLVVAGVAPYRSWDQQVSLERVLDTALSDTDPTNSDRVSIALATSVEVPGEVGVDLAHIVAELVDNALTFSPSDVSVSGHREGDGFELLVSDHGLGIDSAALAAYNDLLANGEVDLHDARRMGFSVIARLAFRHDLEVSLGHQPTGGLVARVLVPAGVLIAPPVAEAEIPRSPTLSLAVSHETDEPHSPDVGHLPRRIRGASLEESLRELPATVIVPENRDPEVVRSSLAALAIGQQAATEYREDHVDDQE
jgi:two-component sensor histidine kinase